MTAKVQVTLTPSQVQYLKMLTYSDLGRMIIAIDHAHSHGDRNFKPLKVFEAQECIRALEEPIEHS